MGLDSHKKAGGSVYRIARWVLIAAAGIYLARKIAADGAALPQIEIRWSMALAALPLVLFALASQVAAWRWNLSQMGARVSYKALFRTYYIANLARYIPGKVWSLAGMVAGGIRLGVAPEIMSASVLLGLVSSLVSGVVVGSIVAALISQGPVFSPWFAVIPIAALVAIWPPVLRTWLSWVLRLFKRRQTVPYFTQRVLWRSVFHYAIVWCGYGGAVGLLGLAVGAESFWLYAAIFPLAYLAGYAALFAPGGWGVREGAIVALAGGGTVAIAVSLAQRLLLTILELVLFSYSVWSWRND